MACLNCGNESVGLIPPQHGDKFMFVDVDTKTNSVHAASGLPVDLYGCTKCGFIHVVNEKLINQEFIPGD